MAFRLLFMNGIVLKANQVKHSLFQTERSEWRLCFVLQNQLLSDFPFWSGHSCSFRPEAAVSASGLAGDKCLRITSAQVEGMAIRIRCAKCLLCRGNLVHPDNAVREALPVCSILGGFLFAGFWWTLNRELTFKAEDWHFKLGIGLLLVAMVMLAVFGVVLPQAGLGTWSRRWATTARSSYRNMRPHPKRSSTWRLCSLGLA
jgi:hypothetical protein